jgi:hypothetical protein
LFSLRESIMASFFCPSSEETCSLDLAFQPVCRENAMYGEKAASGASRF